MKIAVDIDGTLCWSNLPVFLRECNTVFDLKLEQAILDRIEDKQEFYALPEIQKIRKQNEYIDDELAWIEFRETCLLASLLMDDAVEGVARLAQLGELAYYTARYSDIPNMQREIERATGAWLKRHSFVNSEKIIFCDRMQGKIQRIVKLAKNDTVLLVDDSYQSIIEKINQLPRRGYNLLCENLTLLAVRAEADELPPTDFNVIALPYWNEIDTIPLLSNPPVL